MHMHTSQGEKLSSPHDHRHPAAADITLDVLTMANNFIGNLKREQFMRQN